MKDYKRQARERYYRRKKKRQREILLHIGFLVLAAALLLTCLTAVVRTIKKTVLADAKAEQHSGEEKYVGEKPEMDVQLLPINPYSRPGYVLEEVNGIVIHYTANPGTTAQQNRDYFAGLANTGETSASSHFIIGISGEIIQCVPCSEISYASNDRNKDTIAIECCIADETGKFSDATYQSLVELTTWLMGRYSLQAEDVIRHYDVTGKNCPKYFVENEAAWKAFRKDLESRIK